MRAFVMCLFSFAVLFCGYGRAEPDVHDTRLLTYPPVSARNVGFVYADGLCVADLHGRNVRRLTTDTGVQSHPAFSPDGKTHSFRSPYAGNTHAYTIPPVDSAP